MYVRRSTSRRGSGWGRLLMAGAIALVSLISYFGTKQDNPVTGETQYIGITPQQEIALGLEAAPQMAAEFGGLDPDQQSQAAVDQIGNEVVQGSPASSTPYEFEFHLLEDQQTINAFALPGGQIFIPVLCLTGFRRRASWPAFWGMKLGTWSRAIRLNILPRRS